MRSGVTIVILNWNGKKWLDSFLPSVLNTTYQPCEILVVDNGSTDESVSFVRQQFPSVRILELGENYGFAEGNNRALPAIHTPYFALLNSDVEVHPNWLEPLVEALDTRPELASIQPKILAWKQKSHFEYAGSSGGFIDAWGYPFCRGRIFDTLEEDLGQYDTALDVFWATGACCLIRKSVVDKIGLFDPDFFAHMEEIDFCWRAQNHGYRVACEPKSTVYHVGGGTLPQGNPRKTYLNARNNLWMLHKNLPKRLLVRRIGSRLVLDGVWGLKSLLSGEFSTIWAILRGHGAYWKSIAQLNEKRKAVFPKDLTNIPPLGYFPKSIVWCYFIKRIKLFSDLVGLPQQSE